MKVKTILLTTILTMVTVFSGFTASDLSDDFGILYEMAVLDKVRIKREKEEAKKKAEEDKIAAEKKAEEDRIAAEKKNKLEKSMGISAQNPEEVLSKMVKITGMEKGDFYILNTEVTCGLYCKVMGNKGVKEEKFCYPKQRVSCVDAINFCNKLSELCGLKPYYGVPKVVEKVKNHMVIYEKLTCKTFNTNGFRLPDTTEWLYAAAGGENSKYFGSDEIEEVGWYDKNSESPNIVADKKPNKYGLYDMSGNLREWCLNATSKDDFDKYLLGGDFDSSKDDCSFAGNMDKINNHKTFPYADPNYSDIGFRIVRKAE